MTNDPISRALRVCYAMGGPISLLPRHLGQALKIAGPGHWHDALADRPHFEDGGDAGGGDSDGGFGAGNNFGGGSNYGGYSGGTGGFGFGGIGTSAPSAIGGGAISSKSDSGGGWSSSAPAGSSTGGYGGFGGYSSAASVGGSYGGDPGGSFSSSAVSSGGEAGAIGNTSYGGSGGLGLSGSGTSGFGGGSSGGFGVNSTPNAPVGSYGSVPSATQGGFGETSAPSGSYSSPADNNNGFGSLGNVGFDSTSSDGFGSNQSFGSMLGAQAASGYGSFGASDPGSYSGYGGKPGAVTSGPTTSSPGSETAASRGYNDASGWGGEGFSAVTSGLGALSAAPASPATSDVNGLSLSQISQIANDVNKGLSFGSPQAQAPAAAPTAGYGSFGPVSETGGFAPAAANPAPLSGAEDSGDTVGVKTIGISPAAVAGLGAIAGDRSPSFAGLGQAVGPATVDSTSTDPSAVDGVHAVTVHGPYSGVTTADTLGAGPASITAFGAGLNSPATPGTLSPAQVAQQQAYDTQHQALVAPTQKALDALNGTFGNQAASVFGVSVPAMTSFMNKPTDNLDTGKAMLGALDGLKARALNGELSGMGALAHPVDAGAVNQMMSEGGYNDPGTAIDAVKGFITNKMADKAPNFGPLTGTPGFTIGQRPAVGDSVAPAGLSFGLAGGLSPTAVASAPSAPSVYGSLGNVSFGQNTTGDIGSVDGIHALTVHSPSAAATGFSGDPNGAYANAPSLGPGKDYGNVSPDAVRSYIADRAPAYGIDPATAVKVATSEGLKGYIGDNESSFGPFQLHYGNVAPGGNAVGGLGDDFTKATGLDARDPNTYKEQVDFALAHAAQNGWGAFHGAARSNIGDREGIGATPTGSVAPAQSLSPPRLSDYVANDGTISPENAAAYEAAQQAYQDQIAPSPGLQTALSALRGRTLSGLPGVSNPMSDAFNAATQVRNGVPTFAQADYGLTKDGYTAPVGNPLNITKAPDAVDSKDPHPNVRRALDIAAGLVPGLGPINTISHLLGGPSVGSVLSRSNPADVNDPAMMHAAGNSGGGISPSLLAYQQAMNGRTAAPGVTGPAQAAGASSSPVNYNSALDAYLATVGQESGAGSGVGSGGAGMYQAPPAVPLVAPSMSDVSFYDPMQDPYVLAALSRYQ